MAALLDSLSLYKHDPMLGLEPPSEILRPLTQAESLRGLKELDIQFWQLSAEEQQWFTDSQTLSRAICQEYGEVELSEDVEELE